MATYVITEACIGVKDATCVEVCPASCIHTTPEAPQYYIDPEACIACEQCFFVCPVNAIYLDKDVPAHLQQYIEINAEFFRKNRLTAPPIAFEKAAQMLEAIKAYAGSHGYAVSAVVVDPSGEEVVSGRTDGAAPDTAEIALNKAYTSISLQVPTHQLARGAERPTTVAPENYDPSREVPVGGGFPIWENLDLIGGVGVAGCPNPAQDVQCAQAGLEVLRGPGHH